MTPDPMSPGSGIRIELDSDRVDGRSLSIWISKPVRHDTMNCWTCRLRFEADTVREQEIYGASSIQALQLAAGAIPALVQGFLPGEAFNEDGAPVVLDPEAYLLRSQPAGSSGE
jgi:hypothetical protein